MANAAELQGELKEFALSLPTASFPKNFFCALCSQLAFDSWKLPCCNKSICSSCHSKPDFPGTCPLCDHSPLEADSCIMNKSLRSTMRVWLQKQKKKEDAKNASQPATPVVPTSTGLDAPQPVETSDKPVESVELASKAEGADQQDATGGDGEREAAPHTNSVVSQSKENSTALQIDEAQRRPSLDAQNANKMESTSAPDDTNAVQNSMDGSMDGMYGNNGMFTNGMPNQFSYGMNPNQGSFNNGMGWNGMNPMNGMPNMMGEGGWNNMNNMDFNNMNMPNGMYSGFGGNMSMPGMNDMSMMNFGGGYGNGWNGGMNGGYGNFNGYPMGGYNQSGGQFPQMMNQFPKNNFPNQNRFHPNGAAFPQQNNRKGSLGKFGNQNNGPGFQQNSQSRPGSRSGPPQNRDGESPAGDPEAMATETKVKVEHAEASAEPAQEGKVEAEGASDSVAASAEPAGEVARYPNGLTGVAENSNIQQPGGLNHIQTIDSMDGNASNFNPSNNAMQANQHYPQGMMGNFYGQAPNMNGPYGGGMGFAQHNNYDHAGGFNAAYGAATVLTGETRGVGVEGAPTGPRAMREGRPNTGFSSRSYNAKFNQQHQPTPSVSSVQEASLASPRRKGRSSPERDDTLRTKDKSPSRSPSPSRSGAQNNVNDEYRERSRSAERELENTRRDRSASPNYDDEYDHQKEDRHHRSSRYDDYDNRDYGREDHEERYRDGRGDRGDRTRSTSMESRHRSRRDKDKHRSSRSHRDRSREHRRRHRSRSRSPVEERYKEDESHVNGDHKSESNSHRKDKSDKDRYRERNRDRSRDRDRERDRRDRRDRDYDRDYEYEKEKDRVRDRDRDRKRSRRDRDRDEDEREEEDEEHRSSRRSRKDRDRDRDRERPAGHDYEIKEKEEAFVRTASPPLNAPLGPSADGFSIRGISKFKRAEGSTPVSKPMPPPPTGPRALQPPKGPAADRDRERRDSRDHRRKSSISSVPTTPTTPTAPTADQNHNHYAADREKHVKQRVDKDNRDRLISSIHGRATGRANATASSSRPSLSSKRSRDDFEESVTQQDSSSRDREVKIPTGPAGHRDKRRKSGEKGGDNAIANMFTAGLRKQAGKRRGGVKNEGDAERELERVERERDRRW